MHRKLLAGITATIGAAAVIASVAASSPAAADRNRTLVVVQSPPNQQFVDQGAPGPSPGDMLVFASTLADTAGRTIGDVHISCTQNFDNVAVCVGIFRLTGKGQIAVDAEPTFPLPTTGIITGGSDTFFGATGQIAIDPQPDGTTTITFRFGKD
jgi:hypothetical protein